MTEQVPQEGRRHLSTFDVSGKALSGHTITLEEYLAGATVIETGSDGKPVPKAKPESDAAAGEETTPESSSAYPTE